MSPPRTVHAVPAGYLRHFADPRSGKLEAWDLDRRERRELSPDEASPGTDAAIADAALLVRIDALGESLHQRVLAGEALAGDARHGFAFFVASLYLHSPFMQRQGAADRERATAVAGWSHAQLDEGCAAVGRLLQLPPDSGLASVPGLARVARAIHEMEWTVSRASGGSFVTSDSPVNLGTGGPERSGLLGVGLAAANALLTLPLSPAACWLGHWGRLPDPRAWRTAAAVQELNRRRVAQAAHALFALPHAHNLEGLARHRQTNVVALFPAGGRPPPRR